MFLAARLCAQQAQQIFGWLGAAIFGVQPVRMTSPQAMQVTSRECSIDL